MGTFKCFECGEPGHRSSDCRKKAFLIMKMENPFLIMKIEKPFLSMNMKMEKPFLNMKMENPFLINLQMRLVVILKKKRA